jgi:hypothetical protein
LNASLTIGSIVTYSWLLDSIKNKEVLPADNYIIDSVNKKKESLKINVPSSLIKKKKEKEKEIDFLSLYGGKSEEKEKNNEKEKKKSIIEKNINFDQFEIKNEKKNENKIDNKNEEKNEIKIKIEKSILFKDFYFLIFENMFIESLYNEMKEKIENNSGIKKLNLKLKEK